MFSIQVNVHVKLALRLICFGTCVHHQTICGSEGHAMLFLIARDLCVMSQ